MRPVRRDFLFQLQFAVFIFTDPDAHMHLSLPVAPARAVTSSVSTALAGKRSLLIVQGSLLPSVQASDSPLLYLRDAAQRYQREHGYFKPLLFL